jgi:pantoate--beta-alanine ligase
VRAAWDGGERQAERLREIGNRVFATYPKVRVDYFSCADPDTLAEQNGVVERTLVSTAAFVGNVRLIDNLLLE